jgi:hypothetical protein
MIVAMARCYACTRALGPEGGVKRVVYTGTSGRLTFGRRMSYSTTVHSGPRLVCVDCAARIDHDSHVTTIAVVGTALAVIIAVVALSGRGSPPRANGGADLAFPVYTPDVIEAMNRPSPPPVRPAKPKAHKRARKRVQPTEEQSGSDAPPAASDEEAAPSTASEPAAD